MSKLPKIGDAFVEVHADFSKFAREVQIKARNLPDAEIDVKADTDSLRGFNLQLSQTSKSIRTTSKDADRAGGSFSRLGARVVSLNQGLNLLGKGWSLIKWPAIISGTSYAAQGVNNLAAGTAALTGSLSPLIGLLGAAPAAYGALGQAAGVVALAGVKDLTDAMGGNEEALKRLTPEAKRFMGQLQEMQPEFDELRKSAQEGLFEGVADGMDEAVRNFPAFRDVIAATAREMGNLAAEAGRFLGREGFGRDFEAIGRTNAQLLGRMGEAGLNLVDALRHVSIAAQPLVGWLGRMAVHISDLIRDQARAGRESGALQSFFRETKDLLQVLGPMLVDFGKGLWNIIRAGKPLGDDILGVLGDSAEKFREWTESARGQNAIVEWFRQARNPLEQTAKLIRDIGRLFFDVGGGGGLGRMIKSIRKELLPAIEDVIKSGRGFGPVFLDFAIEFARAIRPLLGANGALTLTVQGLSKILSVVNTLIDKVPLLGDVLATYLGARAIGKLLGLSTFGGIGARIGTKLGSSIGGALAGQIGKMPWANMLVNAVSWGPVGIAIATAIGLGMSVYFGTKLGPKLADTMKSAASSEDISKAVMSAFSQGPAEFKEWVAQVREAGTKISVQLVNSWREAGFITKNTAEKIKDELRAMRSVTEEQTKRSAKAFLNMSEDARRALHGVSTATEREMGDAEQSAKKHGKGAGRGISQPYQAADNAAVQALHDIEQQTNKALKGLKQKPVNFGIKAPSSQEVEALHRQRGGMIQVPGRGTGDIYDTLLPAGSVVLNRNVAAALGFARGGMVPVSLEPRELALDPMAVASLGGAARVNRLNSLFPRFATGGFVDPRGPGTGVVNPAIADVVGAWSTRYNAAINYGYDPGGGHVSPGHNVTGTATDTSPAAGWTSSATALFERGLRAILGEVDQVIYGTAGIGMALSNHGRGNHAHIEWGMHPAVQSAIGQMVKALQILGPNHVAKNIAQGTTNLTRSAANKFLRSKMGGIGGGDLGSFGAAGTLGKSQLATLWSRTGRGGDPNLMAAIALAESSGDPQAHGPPDGRGLWQIEWPIWGDQLARFGNPYEPVANARMAHEVLKQQGLGAWVVYNTGAYRQFLQRGGVVQGLQGGGPVRGRGGENPDIPLRDWFKVMYDQPLTDRMKGIVGSISLAPWRLTDMTGIYGRALDADELATVALAGDIEDPLTGAITYGSVQGRTAVGGLGSDKGTGWLDVELFNLVQVRDSILRAIPIVDALTKFVKAKADALTGPGKSWARVAERLYNNAKAAYDRLKARIANLQREIQRLEQIQKPTKEQRERLRMKKGDLASAVNALGVAERRMKDAQFRMGAVKDVSGAFTTKGENLAGVMTQLKTDGAEDGSWPSLQELQGRTGAAGTIFDTLTEINEALRSAGEAATANVSDPATVTDDARLDLLEQQLQNERQLRLQLEAEAPVLERFSGRGFATGGIVGVVPNVTPAEAMDAEPYIETNVYVDPFSLEAEVETIVNKRIRRAKRMRVVPGNKTGVR